MGSAEDRSGVFKMPSRGPEANSAIARPMMHAKMLYPKHSTNNWYLRCRRFAPKICLMLSSLVRELNRPT